MTNKTIRRILPVREYVCPHCFNRIDKCSCDALPAHLVLIDEGVQEHVRILNEKGYATMYCCESHSVHQNLYIAFAYAHGFGSVLPGPEGFKCRDGGRTVERTYGKDSRARKKMTHEQFEAEKKASLDSLLEWAKTLPENAGSKALRGGIVRRPDASCPKQAGASAEEILESYMCHQCGNGVAECTCDFFPPQSPSLMDAEVRPHAAILDEKGYGCVFACAGHGPGSSVRVRLHLAPDEEALSALPSGFAFGRDNGWATVEFDIDAGLSDQEAEAMRQEALASLLSWCEALKKRK